jgi:thiol:disulfide interchange protein DsbC
MGRNVYLTIAVGVLAAIAWAIVQAADTKPDPRAEIAKRLPGTVKPEELTATAIPGIYELQRGREIGYVTADGRYFFSGELHNLKTDENITETRKGDRRRKVLAGVSEKDMLVFGPEKADHTITVFTDVDCGYCRRLHNDIGQLNQLGIRVRYMFYPRSGPNTPSWKKTESIWCASERKQALDRAMEGQAVPPSGCDASAIARQFEIGNNLGVEGTPGIFLTNGAYLPGYLPPQQMLAKVQQLSAKPKPKS